MFGQGFITAISIIGSFAVGFIVGAFAMTFATREYLKKQGLIMENGKVQWVDES